jgi:hypothetical protein
MSAASDPRAAAPGEAHRDAGTSEGPSGPGPAIDAQLRNVVAAGGGLFSALRRLLLALRALVAAEADVLRAGIPLAFIASVALVAFSVSLWACVVALVGWLLVVASGSIGIALGVLVAFHALLVCGIWYGIKYVVRQLSFPHARGELRRLGGTLMGEVNRFVDAAPAAAAGEGPGRAPAAESPEGGAP